ncbi:MAG TPA: DUF4097 family beta strand repeat-containing protein [Longimicrobiales bacterium]|nr:DUF4097 family beta strand repeat-containing protein [Longimicrobiales bacterium]
MRRAPLLLGFVALLAGVPAAAQRPLDERRAASPDGAIRIHNLAGSVRVIGWDRDTIAVRGTVRESGEPFVLHVAGSNAKLGVWPGSGEALPSELEVRVPRRSRVWVKTESADVSIDGVTGAVDVSSVSGGIEVRGAPGEVFVESMAGAIDVAVDARVLRARTAGADIVVQGRITDAQVLSVSGAVMVENKQVERGRFESVDGSVRYRGGVARASSVEFITHSGDIDVALLRGVSARVTVSSFQGEVESLLQGKLVQSGGKGNRQYAQTLGDGGADVVIRTFKGRVRLGYW